MKNPHSGNHIQLPRFYFSIKMLLFFLCTPFFFRHSKAQSECRAGTGTPGVTDLSYVNLKTLKSFYSFSDIGKECNFIDPELIMPVAKVSVWWECPNGNRAIALADSNLWMSSFNSILANGFLPQLSSSQLKICGKPIDWSHYTIVSQEKGLYEERKNKYPNFSLYYYIVPLKFKGSYYNYLKQIPTNQKIVETNTKANINHNRLSIIQFERINEHFYTKDFSELNGQKHGFSQLNELCQLDQSESSGTVAFYRYLDQSKKDSPRHFYTSQKKEAKSKFIDEGILGYIYKEKTENTIPLYRYYSKDYQDYAFTIDQDEYKDDYAYTFDRIEGYVWPPLRPYTYQKRTPLTRINATGVEGIVFSNSLRLIDDIIQTSYTLSKQDSKNKWLKKFNEYTRPNDPYEIVIDHDKLMILVPVSQRSNYQAYLSRIEEDHLTAVKLAKQQQEAYSETKQFLADDVLKNLKITRPAYDNLLSQIAIRKQSLTGTSFDPRTIKFIIPDLQFSDQLSKKGYPYFGKVSFKRLDASSHEIGSYQYTYDKQKPTTAEELYNPDPKKDLKATETTTQYVDRYEVYCDGRKIGATKFTRNQTSTNYEEGSFLGSLLMTGLGFLHDESKLNGFEKRLVYEAQLKGCFYNANPEAKNSNNGKMWFTKAQASLKQQDYAEAISNLDAAIYADPQNQYYLLRANIFSIFNFIDSAFDDYVKALSNKSNSDNLKAEIYRRMAIVLSRLPSVSSALTMRILKYEVSADYADVFLKKADALRDPIAHKLLTEFKSKESRLEQLRLLH